MMTKLEKGTIKLLRRGALQGRGKFSTEYAEAILSMYEQPGWCTVLVYLPEDDSVTMWHVNSVDKVAK
jgi:hypothetical protein